MLTLSWLRALEAVTSATSFITTKASTSSKSTEKLSLTESIMKSIHEKLDANSSDKIKGSA